MRPSALPPAALRAVGVDWGTTHRRACALAADGRCVEAVSDAQGMLAARGRFEAALGELLGAFGPLAAAAPVVLSGMVGSAQGWVDAGYLELPLPLASLRERLVPVPSARAGVVIVPGVIGRGGTQLDVMRGEEAQLLGAVALGHADGWFVLPGTHSKWVRVESGAIVDFATYMTGELFALLSRHGTLAAAMEEGGAGSHRAGAFDEGLNAAADGALSNLLFGVRARVVGGAMAAGDAPSYLSGLLIGAEWHDLRRRGGGSLPGHVTMIAAPGLAQRYTQAARRFAVELCALDAQAVHCAALAALTS